MSEVKKSISTLRLDAEGRVVECDRNVQKTLGSQKEELVGLPLMHLPQFTRASERVQQLLDKIRSGNSSEGINITHEKQGKKTVYRMLLLSEILEESEASRREILAVISNITQETRESEALERKAKCQYYNPFPVFDVNVNGVIGGLLEETEANKPIRENIKDLWSNGLKELVQSALSSREVTKGEVVCGKITYHFRCVPQEGIEIAFVYGLDITEIEELKKAREDADEAKKSADAANQAKSDLLANVSHELRTPLNAILSTMQLFSHDTKLSEEQRRLILLAMGATKQLRDVINDILDLSKIEAGEISIELIPFNLQELMKEVEGVFYTQAKGKGIQLKFNLGEDIPGLIGDPKRIRQIMINLVSNAMKFTERGEIAVNVTRDLENEDKVDDPSNVRLDISVRDTGIGISPEQQKVIFKEYVQAEKSTARKYGGTGLGLPICMNLVRKMGGDICVSSEEGKGTTFHFSLQFSKADESEMLRIPSSEASIEKVLRGHSVMVVDDNPINREVGSNVVGKLGGKEIISVINGEEALRVYKKRMQDNRPVHLILMDITMDEMDGYETTLAIRECEKGGPDHVKIIALTAHALGDIHERVHKAGMDGYVAKPIDLYPMIEEIKRIDGNVSECVPNAFPDSEDDKEDGLPYFDPLKMQKELKAGRDVEGSANLLRKFITSLNETLTQFTTVWEEMNSGWDNSVVKIYQDTHTLKGHASYFGAMQLQQLASNLSEKAQSCEDIPDQLAIFIEVLKRTIQEMEEFLNKKD